jgi:hypothetical protein
MALKPSEKPPDLRDGQSRAWLQTGFRSLKPRLKLHLKPRFEASFDCP